MRAYPCNRHSHPLSTGQMPGSLDVCGVRADRVLYFGSRPTPYLQRHRGAAVEQEFARADDGSACPGCRTHKQARRHAALAAAKRGRVALGVD